MFFLVDCVQRRYFSRSIVEITGILQKTPNLALAILNMLGCYAGLPGTLKFTTEFFIFTAFVEIAPLSSFFIVFVANCLGLIAFHKVWFNAIYSVSTKDDDLSKLDLT